MKPKLLDNIYYYRVKQNAISMINIRYKYSLKTLGLPPVVDIALKRVSPHRIRCELSMYNVKGEFIEFNTFHYKNDKEYNAIIDIITKLLELE